MAIHWIDYVIVATIFLSIITGLFRGFVKEIVALVTWAAGLYCAFLYSERFESLFVNYLDDKTLRMVAAFVAILLVILIVGAIVTKILNMILSKTGLDATDRFLGMGFGLIRGLFTVTLLVIAVNMINIPSINNVSHESILYSKFQPFAKIIDKQIPEFIAKAEKIVKIDEQHHNNNLEGSELALD